MFNFSDCTKFKVFIVCFCIRNIFVSQVQMHIRISSLYRAENQCVCLARTGHIGSSLYNELPGTLRILISSAVLNPTKHTTTKATTIKQSTLNASLPFKPRINQPVTEIFISQFFQVKSQVTNKVLVMTESSQNAHPFIVVMIVMIFA